MTIYPVPATNHLWVTANLQKNDKVHLQLVDLKGKLYLSKYFGRTNHFRERLNVDHLPSGVYYLQVQIGSNNTLMKVLIKQ